MHDIMGPDVDLHIWEVLVEGPHTPVVCSCATILLSAGRLAYKDFMPNCAVLLWLLVQVAWGPVSVKTAVHGSEAGMPGTHLACQG